MIKTEQAQYAIGHVIHSIREACASLVDKRKEIEFQIDLAENKDPLEEAIAIINLRLDTMAKIELNLLNPLIEEYSRIERPIGDTVPGNLTKQFQSRQAKFISSLMQGL